MRAGSARAAALSPPPAPLPEPYYEEYDEEADEYGEYEPQHESLLRNPYVLAAIAVTAAIVLAVMVVAMAGGGGSGGGSGGGQTAVGTESPLTPQAGGIVVETIAAATVREGPGSGGELGSIPRGQKVRVTGRDADAKWFQIVFPQNSTLRGWLPASALKVADLNVANIALASFTPIPRATIPVPTSPPVVATQEPENTPTPAATPEAGPDLAVTMSCNAGSPVAVTIRNAGTAAVERAVSVSVLVGGQVHSTQQVQLSLAPNSAVTVPTTDVVTAPVTSVQVALVGQPGDADPSDNSAQCTVQSGVTPTPAVSTPQTGTTPQASPTPALTATPTVQTVSP